MTSPFEPPSPARPRGVRICELANLPAFETTAQAHHWHEGNGHLPTLAFWRCSHCRCYHYWTSGPTDNNGAHRAGADQLPARIKSLIENNRIR